MWRTQICQILILIIYCTQCTAPTESITLQELRGIVDSHTQSLRDIHIYLVHTDQLFNWYQQHYSELSSLLAGEKYAQQYNETITTEATRTLFRQLGMLAHTLEDVKDDLQLQIKGLTSEQVLRSSELAQLRQQTTQQLTNMLQLGQQVQGNISIILAGNKERDDTIQQQKATIGELITHLNISSALENIVPVTQELAVQANTSVSDLKVELAEVQNNLINSQQNLRESIYERLDRIDESTAELEKEQEKASSLMQQMMIEALSNFTELHALLDPMVFNASVGNSPDKLTDLHEKVTAKGRADNLTQEVRQLSQNLSLSQPERIQQLQKATFTTAMQVSQLQDQMAQVVDEVRDFNANVEVVQEQLTKIKATLSTTVLEFTDLKHASYEAQNNSLKNKIETLARKIALLETRSSAGHGQAPTGDQLDQLKRKIELLEGRVNNGL